MTQRSDLLVWMDLEMTSLVDPREDSIIEIATVITDNNLVVVAEGPEMVIHADRSVFEGIPSGAMEVHEKSGIIAEAIRSAVTEGEAEQKTLAFLEEYITPHTSPLCGNSIYVDRLFLRARMPVLQEYFHYRNLDVSTLKELVRRLRPDLYEESAKIKAVKEHRAKTDIMQSIEELKFYRENFLKL